LICEAPALNATQDELFRPLREKTELFSGLDRNLSMSKSATTPAGINVSVPSPGPGLKLLVGSLMALAAAIFQTLVAAPATPANVDYGVKAAEIVQQLAQAQYDRLETSFVPWLARELPPAKLSELWKAQVAEYGPFDRVTATEVNTERDGYRLVAMTCKFRKSPEADALVAFDEEGHIVGLYFGPNPTENVTGWNAPPYAVPGKFREIAVTVAHGVWHLPGTLTIPNGKGPFPAVVLVPGSPPLDQDATVGPNKIFKDLAFGLASRGVAVLRYTKRTHQAGAGFGSKTASFTLEEELNDDAVAAVSVLASRDEIAHRRIYVVGHSMGGIAAIQIAANDSDIAGIAVMGTPSQDLLTVLLGRVEAMGPDGRSDKETLTKLSNGELGKDVVSLLGQTWPAGYWVDLDKFAPGASAAKLKMPILVMVAGHDGEVPPDDLDSWKKALAGHANATIRFYASLFHLFMPSSATGKGDVPEDWGRPGHVSPEVVNDIASWVIGAQH
jgi:uncharacterized protein